MMMKLNNHFWPSLWLVNITRCGQSVGAGSTALWKWQGNLKKSWHYCKWNIIIWWEIFTVKCCYRGKKTLCLPLNKLEKAYYHDYIQTEMAYYLFLSHMIDNEIYMHVKFSNFYEFSYYSFFPQLAQKNTMIGFRPCVLNSPPKMVVLLHFSKWCRVEFMISLLNKKKL